MTSTELKLDFGKIIFEQNILIAEMNEGILLDVEKNRTLLKIGRKFFKNASYGYISNRVNSYGVNPMIYLESASTPTLIAIAVVTTNPVCRQNAILECQFFRDNNSFEVFNTLEEAKNWIKHKLIKQ
jgi:hypothetical protein